MRHSDRPRGQHGPAWILFAFLVLVLLAGALTAHAASETTPDWHLYAGDAVVDTLDGTPDQAFSAGVWVLLHDSWEIERKDAAKGTLVTAWKPVKHKLVKFAAGPSKVRVAVALKSITPGRTEVRVLGGIASRDPLGGAILPLAQRAGRHECEGYVEELKARLAEDRLTDGAPSASARSTAEKR